MVNAIKQIRGVESVSGRLGFYALLSDGEVSVSVHGIGLDLKEEPLLVKNLPIAEGRGLDELSDREIIIGIGLNKAVHAKPGDRLSLITSTLDGTVNGMDVTVKGIFVVGTTEVDDYVIFMPLPAAKKLLDADSSEKLVIHLDKEDDHIRISEAVAAAIRPFGLQLKGWRELAELFTRVEIFFNQQRVIFLLILGAIILLGIANTVSMTIVERTPEIGTLRALGFEKRDLLGIFLLESIFLGLIGIAVSVPLSAALIVGITAQEIQILLPATSTAFPLALRFTQHGYFQGTMIALWAPLLATLPTMIRVLKIPITDALKPK